VVAAIHGNERRTAAGQTAVSMLLAEASRNGLTPAQAAYVLATAEHESNMGNSMVENRAFAARQNYQGGVSPYLGPQSGRLLPGQPLAQDY
jgi:hypothetical protein